MTLTIRPLQPADIDEAVAIAAASPEAPQWPRSAWLPYLDPDPAKPTLVRTGLAAVDPTQSSAPAILGFSCATLVLDGAENLCQLDSMAVHPSHRRRGIGASLLRELLTWASQNRARHFSLEVRASNIPAIALYQRFGLRQEGRRPRYYAHPEEDALLLGTPVTDGDSPGIFPL